MVSCIDETVANVSVALRAARMWANTLFVFASDNGSPVAGCTSRLRPEPRTLTRPNAHARGNYMVTHICGGKAAAARS